MNLKKITSLTMLTSIIVMSYTGIMLFICPPGRVANWSDWTLFGMNKEEYANVHSTFMVVFLLATILHIYYNWKPITSYMKNEARKLIVFTKEMVVATVLTIVVFAGTLNEISPFSNFVDFSADVSDSWIVDYGEPPYGHAELSSLKLFTKKMGFELKEAEAVLKANQINYESVDENLKDIARKNDTSPEAIYRLIEKASGKTPGKQSEATTHEEKYTGLGRRKISDVASIMGLGTDELIAKMKTIGIDATPDDRFKEISEKYNMSPSDIIEKLNL